jgi:hypothetical protein
MDFLGHVPLRVSILYRRNSLAEKAFVQISRNGNQSFSCTVRVNLKLIGQHLA